MQKNVPILYKKQPAITIDNEGDKILIKFQVTPATATGKPAKYGQLKVREKSLITLHRMLSMFAVLPVVLMQVTQLL